MKTIYFILFNDTFYLTFNICCILFCFSILPSAHHTKGYQCPFAFWIQYKSINNAVQNKQMDLQTV